VPACRCIIQILQRQLRPLRPPLESLANYPRQGS